MEKDSLLIDTLRIIIPRLFKNINMNGFASNLLEKIGLGACLGKEPVTDAEFYSLFHEISITYALRNSNMFDSRYMMAILEFAPIVFNRDEILMDTEMLFTLLECDQLNL